MFRGKYNVTNITKRGQTSVIELTAIHDTTTEENKRLVKNSSLMASPSGTIELTTDNPEAIKWFELDKPYYLDFTRAEEAAKAGK
jgi:hypothetical protein